MASQASPTRIALLIGGTAQDAERAAAVERWLVSRGANVLTLSDGQQDLLHDDVPSPVPAVFRPEAVVACQATEPTGVQVPVLHLPDGDDEDIAHALNSFAAGSHAGPLRTVLVSGYFGAHNRGDDVIVTALLAELSRADDTRIVLATPEAAAATRAYGLPAIDRLDAVTCNRWASIASVVLLGPGGLWDDYSIATVGGFAGTISGAPRSPAHLVQLPLLVRGHGGRFLGVGLGAGPLRDQDSQAAVRLALELADSVGVRDVESRELLASLLPEAADRLVLSPDLAWSAPIPAADVRPPWVPDGPYLAINLRPWEDDSTQHRLWDTAVDFAAQRGLGVVAVPMQPVDQTLMEPWLKSAADEGHPVSLMPTTADHAEFISTLRGAEAVVAMRLHTNLLAHCVGTPAVGLSYHPKVASHFADLQRSEFSLPLTVSSETLTARVESAVDHGLPAALQALVEERRSLAAAELTRIREAVESLPAKEPGSTFRSGRDEKPTENSQPAWLSPARVTGFNTSRPGGEVPIVHTLSPTRLTFGPAARTHGVGDSAEAVFELAVTAGAGFRATVQLQSLCPQIPELEGNFTVEVLVGSDVRYSSDIASWSPRTEVVLTGWSPTGLVTLRVRVRALRNTQDLGWDTNAQIRVFRADLAPWGGSRSLSSTTNPLASTAGPVAWSEDAPQPEAAPVAAAAPPNPAKPVLARPRHIDGSKHRISHHSSVGRFLDLDEISPGFNVIQDGGIPIDVQISDRGHSTTVVTFHAAAPPDVTLPFLVGQGVTRDLPVNRIYVSDPTLALSPRLNLGWFAGSMTQRFQPAFTAILRKILSLRPEVERVVFFGPSGGGFASLYFAAQFPGSFAVALNPQTSIARYLPAAVERYAEVAFGITGRDPIGQLPVDVVHDLTGLYSRPVDATVLYAQNLTDDRHVSQHAVPFFDRLHPANRAWWLGSDGWGEGDVAPPTSLTTEILRAVTAAEPEAEAEQLGFRRVHNA